MRLKPAYREETRVSVDLGFGDAERHCKHFLKARSFSAGDAADDLGNGKGRGLFCNDPPWCFRWSYFRKDKQNQ